MIDKNFTVYVIDDDAAVRCSLMWMIEQEGICVQVFEDAKSFMDIYHPDLRGIVITDVNMPGMDGMELQEVLLQDKCALSIIFLTGYGNISMSVKAIKSGAVDFLTKPITRAKLMACIQSAFEDCKNKVSINKNYSEANSRLSKLSEREMEIMKLVVQGCTNKEIAAKLGISFRTVEIHRSHIMQKTGSRCLLDLVQIVQESDLNGYRFFSEKEC